MLLIVPRGSSSETDVSLEKTTDCNLDMTDGGRIIAFNEFGSVGLDDRSAGIFGKVFELRIN